MQLMKQNGLQVNNNNSNSTERLHAQQQSPQRAAVHGRGEALAHGLPFNCWLVWKATDLREREREREDLH